MTTLQETDQKRSAKIIKKRIKVLERFIKKDFGVPWLEILCGLSFVILLLSVLVFAVTIFLQQIELAYILHELSIHSMFINYIICMFTFVGNVVVEQIRKLEIVGQISMKQAKAELEHLSQKLKNMENVKTQSANTHVTVNNNKSGSNKNGFNKSKQKIVGNMTKSVDTKKKNDIVDRLKTASSQMEAEKIFDEYKDLLSKEIASAPRRANSGR